MYEGVIIDLDINHAKNEIDIVVVISVVLVGDVIRFVRL